MSSLFARSTAQIGYPHRDLLIFRDGGGISFVMIDRTLTITEIQVTQDRQVPTRREEAGVEVERGLVMFAGLVEAPLTPPNDS